MKNKTKIGLLGGAFDPITKGHIQLARFVLNNTDIDQVRLSPCYSHPFNKKMISPTHRLKMCELATALEPKISVFNYEIRYQTTSTYHFLKYLPLQWKMERYDFSYIIGMDNANNFDKWVESEKLKKLIRFIVVSRQGIKANKDEWYKKSPHICLEANDSIMKTSSTQVKNLLKKGEYGKAFDCLHFRVNDYILKNGLYS